MVSDFGHPKKWLMDQNAYFGVTSIGVEKVLIFLANNGLRKT